MGETEDYDKKAAPTNHAASHEDGGADEIDCAGLAGRINLTDRGDPAAYDFELGDIIQDSAWHTFDLSSIVPVGAKVVLIEVRLLAPSANADFSFRKPGHVNDPNVQRLITRTADTITEGQLLVFLNTERQIEYMTATVGWTAFALTVSGWFV